MRHQFAGLLLALTAALVPLGAQQRAAEINPKKAMNDARAAIDAGRAQDALKLYDAVTASPSRDAVKFKTDALYGATVIRLSPGASAADMERARTDLDQLLKSQPPFARRQEVAALLHLFEEMDNRSTQAAERAAKTLAEVKAADAAQQQQRVDALNESLAALKAELESGSGDAEKLRQTVATLRSENRNLRDQLARTQADLEKKDAALRKIAGSIVR